MRKCANAPSRRKSVRWPSGLGMFQLIDLAVGLVPIVVHSDDLIAVVDDEPFGQIWLDRIEPDDPVLEPHFFLHECAPYPVRTSIKVRTWVRTGRRTWYVPSTILVRYFAIVLF